MMEEAEMPTREQTVNPEISNLRKLPPSLGRGVYRKEITRAWKSPEKA